MNLSRADDICPLRHAGICHTYSCHVVVNSCAARMGQACGGKYMVNMGYEGMICGRVRLYDMWSSDIVLLKFNLINLDFK